MPDTSLFQTISETCSAACSGGNFASTVLVLAMWQNFSTTSDTKNHS